MKRLLVLFVALSLCLTFAGCLEENGPYKEIGETQTKEEQAGGSTEKEELVFGLNETAVFSTLKFTATEMKESQGTDFFEPAAGKTFVGIKFTIENISDETVTVSSLLMFEAYADDIKCDYSFNAACAFDEGTLDGDVAPGKKLVGWYALEVNESWNEIELHIQKDWLSNSVAKFAFAK